MSSERSENARERILAKIKAGQAKVSLPMPFPDTERLPLKDIYTADNLPTDERFATEFIALGGKFVFCNDEQELLLKIHALYDEENWQQLLCSEPNLLRLFHSDKMDFILPADTSLEFADACITACEFLVARTGSVILSSRQPLGRSASIYFPVHIIVAYPHQLVRDIDEGLASVTQKYNGQLPSMINLNTGASRTADIEKTLVVGIHGPKEVYVFFVNK